MKRGAVRTDAMNIPELLAPAGSPAAFRAAVAAGADAVYLGGKRFGARKYAGNFTGGEIEEAVAYAHARGVKVYVTVNTLIHDRELEDVGSYLVWLYSIGVDAVLVQDLGIAALARKIVPDLPLHASTQMTIHNADGVRWASGLGFSRVVLARELTLDEIRRIAEETAGTGTGLEVFAHGALCFSYSGCCLLSSVIGGRSGNRGMCAQPCRKPYTLVAATIDAYGRPETITEIPQQGDYLLSPKDLCTYPRLKELAAAPVVSLKIEGRMKSEGYVAIVTAAYRRALDEIARGGDPEEEDALSDLALAFNRGFTDGYLFKKRHSAVMGREQPGNRGLRIGTVEEYRGRSGEALVRLDTATTPVAGDGLFIHGTGEQGSGTGFALNTSPARTGNRILLPVPGMVRKGDGVFMTSGTALAAETRRIIAGGCRELQRTVPVDCTVTVAPDGQVTISGRAGAGDGRQVMVSYQPETRFTPARTHPLTAAQLRGSLEKTGGTPFSFRKIEIRYDGSLFAPVSAVNSMRREFLSRAKEALIASYRPDAAAVRAARERCISLVPEVPAQSRRGNGPERTLLLVMYTDTLEGVGAAAKAGCDTICFEPKIPLPSQRCGSRAGDLNWQLLSAGRLCRDAGITFVWRLPRVTRPAELDMLRAILPGLYKEGLSACMAGNMGAVAALRLSCPGIRILGSEDLPVFNYAAAAYAASFCDAVTLSPELSGPEIAELIRSTRAGGCAVPFWLVVQGNAEVMVAENCLIEPVLRCSSRKQDTLLSGGFLGIRDSTGSLFPITVGTGCRTRVMNADETCLLDHLPAIHGAGVSAIIIDARGRPAPYIREAGRIYRDAIRATLQDRTGARRTLETLKQQIRKISRGNITAGHFVRGLLAT